MKVPVEKNKEYIVDIIDNGFEGEGIAKIDNFTVFIPNCIKGEKVKILIVKVLSSHAFGKIMEIIQPSSSRVEADCLTYKRCGGCNLRHVKYEETLKMKRNAVQSLVNKTLKNKIKVEETIGMENPYNYRNKAQYPVGLDKNNNPQIGVFASRTHDIIPIEKCMIQNLKSQEIAKSILEFWNQIGNSVYNEKTGKGLLRHIVIKVGFKTQEFMCVLVINGKSFPKEKELTNFINEKFPEVKTIVKNVNMKNTNVILGLENINIFGDGYITDILGEYTFKISPLSFYQVNPVQAEKLYKLGVEAAKINKEDIVFDLYCGIGTITLFMSKFAKKVIGVEIVKQAVEDAKENARINNVKNVEFIAGDTEIVLDDLIKNKSIIPDVVMFDPPRKGLDNKSIENILKIKPYKVGYISCNPASLVRDLAKFEETYDIVSIQPVDMFPFTTHVECVALMGRKES
ncbi:MAG: 23S rRNA (uracil(1939)-C(5))-methyltransferase RlmD [Clostridia bacterium]|nr:23S rRNA (uracil(1939)-C(5))-methyltransferase RlmD [Clostridia bacterium]